MNEYTLFEPGEEYTFDPRKSPLQLACCDCSLVHKMYFKVNKDGTITFNLEVNEEETKRLRGNPAIRESVLQKKE